MKKDIKILSFKLFICGLLIIGFSPVYNYFFYESDLQTYSPAINQSYAIAPQRSEIVYIGESSNITTRSDDFDKRSIGEFISDYYPHKKIGYITKVASHAGIFYELLRNIPKKSAVKTVIVTMNLRSFAADWIDSELETPLQRDIVLLKDRPPLLKRILLGFKGYDVKTDKERQEIFKKKWREEKLIFPKKFSHDNVEEWEHWIAVNGIKDSLGNVDWKATELATHYIKSYAFQIDTHTNPRIKDFDNIVELAKKRNWNLIFNLIAENTEKANQLLGYPLTYLMNQNKELLLQRYQKNGVFVADNLNAVTNKDFIEQHWTSEHYAERGRKAIAENVAEKLQVFYPKDYRRTDTTDIRHKTVFFNNCEGETKWEQMQMLTIHEHFSGKKSSQALPYSITFAYPTIFIRNADSVYISFKYLQKYATKNVKLVIEVQGENATYNWFGKEINELASKSKHWQAIKFRYPLPESFAKSDLIKVYIYNPDLHQIHIDDLRIDFKIKI
ncbi:DUF4843 domain-containing protein [Pedobacter arcticus]|uniref:DUF4843 domain-containing protein n=1 Tax=Pedobacter arcticus TaxID=752140 RepID=UPI0003023055|nr:DUF4843 domain-containing protein [Pedobacter arcticus]